MDTTYTRVNGWYVWRPDGDLWIITHDAPANYKGKMNRLRMNQRYSSLELAAGTAVEMGPRD